MIQKETEMRVREAGQQKQRKVIRQRKRKKPMVGRRYWGKEDSRTLLVKLGAERHGRKEQRERRKETEKD